MGTDPLGVLTLFVTQMIALSVAAERVTETVKQWICPYMTHWTPARYAAAIQTIAIASGVAVTCFSGLNPLNMPKVQAFAWSNPPNWLSWLIGGLLVSGGSAFWNHLLDMLKAAKVQKEELVSTTTTVASAQLTAP